MADWLTPGQAALLVESPVSQPDTDGAWTGAVDAACAYVERLRADLVAGDPPVFVADGAIKLGTAMLVNRLYTRRRSPLGTSQNVEFGSADFLRQDPDIAKLLGIGAEGRFVFGAARTIVELVDP